MTGDLAWETTAYVEQFWRLAGNSGFDSSIYRIVAELQKAGYVAEGAAQPTDRLTYRIERRAMTQPTWEPVDAEVTMAGTAEPLLRFTTNRNMLPVYSTSTPGQGITGEVVWVESLDDIKKGNVQGKIVFAEAPHRQVFEKAVKENGALAVLTYDSPAYLQPEKNQTSIQFRSIGYQQGRDAWGIALSYAAKETLKTALAKGQVSLTIKAQTKIYPAEELTVVAEAQGAVAPAERLVFSAHVQEPGANDNATGTGTQVEMAAVTARLVKNGSFNPQRTITFLWGDEIVSTRRYIQEDSLRAKGIKWGISLDMVGENTALTGGSFLIEKMPDPSAIWTRGQDKHTEWGTGDVAVEDLRPHYFNDFMLNRFREQGAHADWQVGYNPFEGGSDHVPFLEGNIPGLLLWHFTDQFYHTDNDRLDKVSKLTLRNVGTAALASAFLLANADEATALQVLTETKLAALTRLNEEFALSRKAIGEGGDRKKELTILNAWTNWYTEAIGSVRDMEVGGSSANVVQAISAARQEVEKYAAEQLEKLK